MFYEVTKKWHLFSQQRIRSIKTTTSLFKVFFFKPDWERMPPLSPVKLDRTESVDRQLDITQVLVRQDRPCEVYESVPESVWLQLCSGNPTGPNQPCLNRYRSSWPWNCQWYFRHTYAFPMNSWPRDILPLIWLITPCVFRLALLPRGSQYGQFLLLHPLLTVFSLFLKVCLRFVFVFRVSFPCCSH